MATIPKQGSENNWWC